MLNYIADSVRNLDASVERGFEGIRRELAELPRHYVPRLEIDRRFDEVCLDVAELRRRHEQDQRDRAAAETAAAAVRRAERWQRITLGLGTATALGGTLAGIFLHFS